MQQGSQMFHKLAPATEVSGGNEAIQQKTSASYIGLVTNVCSKEELGLKDAPKDAISRVVGAGI